MTMQTGGIKVRILGDDSDLQEKLRDSANDLVKWGAAAAAAVAAGTIHITKETASAAKEVDNLSRLVRMSTADFQRNAAAAKSVGIEQDKYADILKDVQDKIGDFMATGAGPMADFFEQIAPKIGVTADEFKNLSGQQALQLYVDSLEKANVSQNEMTFYLEAIASDAALLEPLLINDAKAMKELGDRAQAAGAVLSDMDIAKLEQLNQKAVEGQEAFKGFTNTLAVQFAPIISGVGDLLVENAGGADAMKEAIQKAYDITIKGAAFAGDMLRGFHVILKGLEAAFFGLQAVAAGAFLAISKGVDAAVNFSKEQINSLIDGMNKIPGVDLERLIVGESAATQKLEFAFEAAKTITAEKFQEMHDLAMEPMPSDAIEAWAQAVQDNADKAAAAVVQAKENAALVVPTIETGANDPEVKATIEKNAALMAAYDDYYMMRSASGEDFSKTDLERQKDYADKMKAIDSARFNDSMKGASQFFGNLSSLMNTESKALFETGKAAAISQAVVDGIAAAVSSFKYGASLGGPILGGAFAAASAVATGVQIASLASTTFGSGARSTPTPSVSVPTQSEAVTGQSGSAAVGTSSTLFIESLSPDALLSGSMVNSLIEKLRDAQRDGQEVVLT